MMKLQDQLWKIATDLFEEPTTLEAISTHICYIITSSFAFFFFVEMAGLMTRDYIIVTDSALRNVNYLLAWSNFFINILTMLIIFEVSSYIAKAYWDYRRDNL
jgi:hypothetical protein